MIKIPQKFSSEYFYFFQKIKKSVTYWNNQFLGFGLFNYVKNSIYKVTHIISFYLKLVDTNTKHGIKFSYQSYQHSEQFPSEILDLTQYL